MGYLLYLGLLILMIGITMDGHYFLAIDTIPMWFKMDVVPLICIGGYLLFTITQI